MEYLFGAAIFKIGEFLENDFFAPQPPFPS